MSDDIHLHDAPADPPREMLHLQRPKDGTAALGTVVQGSPCEFALYYHLRVIEQVMTHIKGRGDVEVGGILLGYPCTDEQGVWLRIDHAVPAHQAASERLNLTFTHDAWDEMLAERDRIDPDSHVVGWYHTHPGLGVFLSKYDRFIHSSFFTRPLDVALVVDPHTFTWKTFIWENSELSAASVFHIYSDDDRDFPELQEFVDQYEQLSSASRPGWLKRLFRGER